MAKIKLQPMDHMYDRRGRHLMNSITMMPVFVTVESEVEVDDDVAEATLAYIEENRKNFDSYLRPVEILPDNIAQPEVAGSSPQPVSEVKEDGEAQ
jgi:hypothetical protein